MSLKNFDEKTVNLLHSQVFGLLYNVLTFYELYRDREVESTFAYDTPISSNILDRWIISRLDQLIKSATENLDSYKLLEPVREVRDFIGDLSTWYLRRSRERIKNEDKDAKQTLYFILKTLAKVMAPFAPFAAEDIYLKLKVTDDRQSVHLCEWPEWRNIDTELLNNMQVVRNLCTAGNAERQKLNIPIRHPLSELRIKNYELKKEYLELIKNELNVKEIKSVKNLETEVALEANITEELKQEGNYRELVRALQDMRKKMGLTPNDNISLSLETNEEGKNLIQKFELDIKKTVLVSKIEFGVNNGHEIKIDSLVFKVKIDKI